MRYSLVKPYETQTSVRITLEMQWIFLEAIFVFIFFPKMSVVFFGKVSPFYYNLFGRGNICILLLQIQIYSALFYSCCQYRYLQQLYHCRVIYSALFSFIILLLSIQLYQLYYTRVIDSVLFNLIMVVILIQL